MKIEDISSILKDHAPGPIGVKNKYSVLIPLIEIDGELNLLYEIRSKSLRNQPGEISFPGGRIEDGEDYIQAAIRETSEELCIPEDKIEVVAEGDFLINPYHAIIYSVVGKLNVDAAEIKASRDEVDSVFYVPLKYFLENEPDIYELDLKVNSSEDFPYELIPNGKNYKFKRGMDRVHFYKYKGKIIWGFTAKLTYNFIQSLKCGNNS
ncbi:NUDIX hydrolase [Peptoniphilus asaccharolyticus]